MKAAVVGDTGLEIREIDTPKPGPAEVLIRVRAVGLNRADAMVASGMAHGRAGGPGTVPGIEYVGEETCTVGAGTFDALHFRIVGTEGQLPETHPPYDMWCTADGDYIFLKGAVTGYMMTHYELIELER